MPTEVVINTIIQQFVNAIPVVVAYLCVRRSSDLVRLIAGWVATVFSYFAVTIASAFYILGRLDIAVIPNMFINLIMSIGLPVAWVFLSALWIFLFRGVSERVVVERW